MSNDRGISERTYSRRTTLKAGAVTAGAVALGGMTGVAGAKGPKGASGRAFAVTGDVYEALAAGPFSITGPADLTDMIPSSCNNPDGSSEQEFAAYMTDNANNIAAYLWYPVNRAVNTGPDVLYEIHNAKTCGPREGDPLNRDWVEVRVKPAKA